MVSLKNSLFFASHFECTAPLFFLFLNSMNRKKTRYFLCILFFNPSFWVLFSTFHYTFDIKIHYPPTYLKPYLPLSGWATCRIRYYHRGLPGRSAGVNFPKGCASPRQTDNFSNLRPGAERCLFRHPWTGKKKSWLSRALSPVGIPIMPITGCVLVFQIKPSFLCIWKLGSFDHRNDEL